MSFSTDSRGIDEFASQAEYFGIVQDILYCFYCTVGEAEFTHRLVF